MKVAIIDYGMGNLGSVRRAFAEVGAEALIAERPQELADAERIVLPGVGSFADGMASLCRLGWADEIRHQALVCGKPLLGICLGMQLLASRGCEGSDNGETAGLDLIPGDVVRLDGLGCTLRIPHVGWNTVAAHAGVPLLAGIPAGTDFYFVHSYAFRPENRANILATTDYGIEVVAAVGSGHVVATQFHPEKSSRAGFRLLQNFLTLEPC